MTLLHFNDVYNVEPREKEPVGGVARFVTRVRELKKEATERGEGEAVCLFSGDAFNPSLTSTVTHGAHMVNALNAVGIECACFGNHDFDFGVDQLLSMARETNFPWLMSNVHDKRTGRPLADGCMSHMIDFHGRKVGLLGLVESEWLVTLATIGEDDVEYEDFCVAGRRVAKDLRKQGAEAVIGMTHMRMPNDYRLAREVPEIDLILGGHDHHYEVTQVEPHGTYVLNSGTDFRDLTELRIRFTDGGPRPLQVESTRHVEIESATAPDPEMEVFVNDCMAKVGAAMDEVVCESAVDLDSRFQAIRTSETNAGNLVADIMRAGLEVDIGWINSGTLRADAIFDKGPIKLKDVVNLLPMIDELCVLELLGSQVMNALENSVSQYPRLEGRFAQVSGINFTFDAAKSPGARVDRGSVMVGGQPLLDARSYKLVTKDYLRQGKDGYDVFKEVPCLADGEQAGDLRTLVTDYFRNLTVLNGDKQVASEQSLARAKVVADTGWVARIGDGPDLLRRYALSPQVDGRITCLNPDPAAAVA